MIRLVCFFLIFINSFSICEVYYQGYKNKVFQLNANRGELCEFAFSMNKQWCTAVEPTSMGMHVAFNHVHVYSKVSLQSVDIIKKRLKWNIPLHNIHKLHIQYPVIVTLSNDQQLSGYDFFTGTPLWTKKTTYHNLFAAGNDIWMHHNGRIEKFDAGLGEVVDYITFEKPIQYLTGKDTVLFIQFDNQLIHYNRVNHHQIPIGRGFRVIDQASHAVIVGNDTQQQLRTYSNQVISANLQETLFKVHTPKDVLFAFKKNNTLVFFDDSGMDYYEFTPTKNSVRMGYNYKISNQLRHFGVGGKNNLWTLKRINKPLSDQDS